MDNPNTITRTITGIELKASNDSRRWTAVLFVDEPVGKNMCVFLLGLGENDVTRVLAAQRALVRRYDTANPGDARSSMRVY